MLEQVVISQPANPEYLKDWFNDEQNEVIGLNLLTVDFRPLIYYENQKTKFFHKNSKVFTLDCATMIITSRNRRHHDQISNHFVLATDVFYWYDQARKIHNLALGGIVHHINDLMKSLVKTHDHFQAINFDTLNTLVTTSNDQATIKAYRKLAKSFSPQAAINYSDLELMIDHHQKAQVISKNLILKKLIAWYYAKQSQIQGGI